MERFPRVLTPHEDVPPDAGTVPDRQLRVAVVHEWLVGIGGSELVTAEILRMWPNADLFAVCDFLSDTERAIFDGRHASTTFIQRLPLARRRYQAYLPLMPLAIEQIDLSSYDLVISSSHAVAKGVITGPRQFHVSYVHSPMRYAWDLQHEYLRQAGLEKGLKSWIARYMLHRLRVWDSRTASGVDSFVANSRFVAARVLKAYRRDAVVIHPPVDVERFALHESKDGYYLTASRLAPYKHVATIVEAFRDLPDRKLVVVGDGPEMARIKRMAGANVEILGYRSNDSLRDLMQRARAFVFCAEEDFGIAPVEAQACGTPVIAYGEGGALETVIPAGRDGATGLFFCNQSAAAVRQAIVRFESTGDFDPHACRRNAERFGTARFRDEFRALVQREHGAHLRKRHGAAPHAPFDGQPLSGRKPAPEGDEVPGTVTAMRVKV